MQCTMFPIEYSLQSPLPLYFQVVHLVRRTKERVDPRLLESIVLCEGPRVVGHLSLVASVLGNLGNKLFPFRDRNRTESIELLCSRVWAGEHTNKNARYC